MGASRDAYSTSARSGGRSDGDRSTGEERDVSPEVKRSYRSVIVRAAIGAVLVAVLIARSGATAIGSLLARERLVYFAAAVAIYVAGQVLSAYRWRLLAAMVSIRGSFHEFVAYYFVGVFTNLFVPGLVGGDAARALYLGRRHARLGPAMASAIADRAVGLIGMLWFAAAGAWLVNGQPLRTTVIRPLTAIALFSFLAYLAGPLISRMETMMPHRFARYAGLITPYIRHPARLVPALILSVVLQASLVFCQYLLAVGLGLSFPLSLFVLCVPIANLIGNIPITFSGLGLREGAYVVLFAIAGVGRPEAIAIGLLWFATVMVGGSIAIVPFLTTEVPTLRAAKAVRVKS
jgi:uncharacterized membrane protein YbhN (UPF0104 family)